MNYCQFRNEFIKRMTNAGGGGGKLPAEYQAVEYIRSTGVESAYIITTISNQTPIEYETVVSTNGLSDEMVFGTYGSDSRLFVALKSHNGNTQMGYGTNYAYNQTSPTANIYYKISGIFHSGEQKVYIDDVLNISTTFTSVPVTDINIAIYARNNSNGVSNNFRGNMQYFKLWSNGRLIFDGIACYRKSDSVSGLYDTVTKTLYASRSGKNFIVGNDVQ